MTGSLEDIRAEIDALDADLRAGLLRRAQLVAQIAAAKAANSAAAMPLRPMREMQQMRLCALGSRPKRQCSAPPDCRPFGAKLSAWR